MSDMPPPQMPEPEEPAEKPFWKRWWFIAGAIFVVLMAIGAGAEEVEEEPVAAESTAEEEASEAKPTAAPTPVATEMESEVEVTEEPEEIVAEETEYELTEEDMRTGVFPIVFDSGRDAVIEILQGMFVVESVDQYVYDADSGTVLVSLTPKFDFEDGVRDDAWEVMRAFAVLYDEESWVEPTRTFIPTLEVDISTAHYRCDGETMVALNEARLSRADWDSTCRVG